jgi:hypothetical protein
MAGDGGRRSPVTTEQGSFVDVLHEVTFSLLFAID